VILQFDNVSKSFAGPAGPVHAVRDVSLSVDAGEFVAVQGPSGCGKTTLLLVAGALLRPTAGDVQVLDAAPYALSGNRRARFRADHVGFVFQQFHLVPYLNVVENILAPAVGRPGSAVRDRALELVEQFRLADRVPHLPEALSTGERQRTALARAFLNGPELILADEPTGNLDDANARTVLDALAGFARDGGGVLLVTHDARAAGYANRTLRMDAGALTG
jgi:ABC-type lipoprotein export system ATPase subunit